MGHLREVQADGCDASAAHASYPAR
jgi:hypothetical protein